MRKASSRIVITRMANAGGVESQFRKVPRAAAIQVTAIQAAVSTAATADARAAADVAMPERRHA
jgi:hypothetical protein